MPSSPILVVAVTSGLIGIAMGVTSLPVMVSVQTSVGYAQRGTVTSLIQFARTMGGATGVAGLGSLFTAQLGPRATEASALLDPVARRSFDPAAAGPVREGLASGLHAVFVAMVVVAVAAAVLARRLPRDMPEEAERAPIAVSA